MISIISLWLPIILSAVAVFITSSVLHMVLTYHRSDFKGLDAEDQVMAALRDAAIPPGEYIMPHCENPKDSGSPEFLAKIEKGPVATLNIMAGGYEIGKSLAYWFVYCLLMGVFVAYLAGRTLDPGAHYLDVFRLVGTASFGAYGLALLQNSIWYKRPWITSAKHVFDSFIYACLTAGIFGWLWPA
jgi:hypothetical protein